VLNASLSKLMGPSVLTAPCEFTLKKEEKFRARGTVTIKQVRQVIKKADCEGHYWRGPKLHEDGDG